MGVSVEDHGGAEIFLIEHTHKILNASEVILQLQKNNRTAILWCS